MSAICEEVNAASLPGTWRGRLSGAIAEPLDAGFTQ